MVGRDRLQVVSREAAPEPVLRLFRAQWRAHHVLRAVETGLLVVVVGKEEVLRARLGVSGEPAVARLRHHFERFRGREVDDVDRDARHLRERDRAVGRLAFRAGRAGERVVLRLGLPFGERLLHQHVDHSAVLGVHADRSAVLPGAKERPENRAVVEHEHAGVGHEQLERRHAFGDERVHLPLDGVGQLGDDHVEAVVDRGLPLRLAAPRVERVPQRLSAVLDREVDDRGRAATGRRDRAGFEVVRGRRASEGHVEVGMDVDAAGDHVFAGSVDYGNLTPFGDQSPRRHHGRNLLVFDQNVPAIQVGRRHDRAAADEGFQGPSSAIGW